MKFLTWLPVLAGLFLAVVGFSSGTNPEFGVPGIVLFIIGVVLSRFASFKSARELKQDLRTVVINTCLQCGHSNGLGQVFCGGCGSRLLPPVRKGR